MTFPADAGPPALRVVVYREAHYWLAQGLEHDIGVQAERLTDLLARLAAALQAELARSALADLPPAPPYFQALWPMRAGLLEPSPDSPLAAVGRLYVVLALVA